MPPLANNQENNDYGEYENDGTGPYEHGEYHVGKQLAASIDSAVRKTLGLQICITPSALTRKMVGAMEAVSRRP